MIEIKNLKKNFNGLTAVDVESLNMNKGELIGLVGNNGAGKTTLMRLMLDLLKADSGYVTIDGEDVSKGEKWKTITGSFLDSGFLIDFYTPDELLDFICDAYKIDKTLRTEYKEPFKQLFTDELWGSKKYISTLSSGNRQKVGIASAIISHPDVIILDEPFNFLDPSSQVEVHRLLKAEAERGALVIVSSHSISQISNLCSRVLLMEKARIVNDIDNKNGEAETILSTYFNA